MVKIVKNEHDKFFYEIQKNKMKELWDNKKDESWEADKISSE